MLYLGLAIGIAVGGVGGIGLGVWACIGRVIELKEQAQRAEAELYRVLADRDKPIRLPFPSDSPDNARFIASAVKLRNYARRVGY